MIRTIGLVLLVLVATGSQAATNEPSVGAPEALVLTLYSDGVALVYEERRAVLRRGVNRVSVSQLPSGIDSTSIRVVSKDVALVKVLGGPRLAPSGHPKPMQSLREDSPRHSLSMGEAIPSSGPDGTYELEWELEANRAIDQAISVTYLARTIQYSASLDVVLNSTEQALFEGWVSIDNRAGRSFDNASVVLVTGPTHPRESPLLRVRMLGSDSARARREVKMPEPVTLPAGQRRRLRVFSQRVDLGPERIVVNGGGLEAHEARLDPDSLMNRGDLGSRRVHAERRRRMGREDFDALVRALPPLVRRVYSGKPSHTRLLVEESVDPAMMSMDLPLGRAADIDVRRRQLSFKRRESGHVEETLEFVVANSRSEPVQVEIMERLFRSEIFEIEGSSHSVELRDGPDGPLAVAALSVPAQGQAKFTFTMIYRR